MKPSIQLRFAQNLNLTPNLQQAMRLLQLSTVDLQQEIQEALESNLMLEDENIQTHDSNDDENLAPTTSQEIDPTLDNYKEDKELNQESINISDEWPIDSDWTDFYDNYALNSNHANEEYSDNTTFSLEQKSGITTLRDYLTWQSNISDFSDIELLIAVAIIDSINEDGYLIGSLEDILTGINNSNIQLSQMLNVLQRIQEFDPPGVGARNLQECLLIQLRQLSENTAIRYHAIAMCENYFELLKNQNFIAIKEALSISDKALQSIINLLRTLHPYPGLTVTTATPQYVIPDVFVTKHKDNWRVELNSEIMPHLRVNPNYANLIRRADRSADNLCLKKHLQEARWFLKNLANRNETLLRVASKIVELQRNFFEYGPEAMRPLVLHDVAEALSIHDSTVSRVTNQKYLHSPRGTFELKFFFSSHVNTNSGEHCSATAICAIIKKLINAEPAKSPLSDNDLANLLIKQGINVARRTISKYRESIGIPSSTQRKRTG